ncbi:hypothetical protein GN156_04005 [bacterium LRH843]|nr:hypothetical protein [bacterium LRH843]
MSFKVLNNFREKGHNNTVYSVGDIYPAEGFKADEKRVSFLQEIHPVYCVRFLDSVEEEKAPEKPKKAPVKKKSDAK